MAGHGKPDDGSQVAEMQIRGSGDSRHGIGPGSEGSGGVCLFERQGETQGVTAAGREHRGRVEGRVAASFPFPMEHALRRAASLGQLERDGLGAAVHENADFVPFGPDDFRYMLAGRRDGGPGLGIFFDRGGQGGLSAERLFGNPLAGCQGEAQGRKGRRFHSYIHRLTI